MSRRDKVWNTLRAITRFFKWVTLISLSWFLLHSAVVIYVGLTDDLGYPTDVGVVLGNEVLAKGKPSPRLKARLDRAVGLYTGIRINKVLVSGGFDQKGFDEAAEMAQYLRTQGVAQEDILVDHFGDNTFFTASNTRRVLAPFPELRTLTLISSTTHILRTKLAFQRCGFEDLSHAHARYFEWRDIYWSLPREFVGYYVYRFWRTCPPSELY
jgi:vancomycin permeability regulator SanA